MEQKHHYIGLTDAQVIESRRQHGENILTPPKKESLWVLFLEKFTDPIIIILLVALVLSIGVSCYEFFSGHAGVSTFFEPAGILIAVLLATVVGFCFELSANKKFEVLNKVNDDTLVKVIRNGNICQIPKKEIVVGDIVILETGEEVPADGELLEAVSLQINESTLTGEPVIKKTTNPADFKHDATYPSNHALKGTTVADGHGIMQILKVGDASEYGKVYEGAQIDSSVETPLNQQLNRLADMITKASYAIAALIIIGRLFVYFHGIEVFDWIAFGGYFLKTVMIAVTVIVVAVPEGLPMSVTLSLALSMKRMLSTNNLVRKMHACETMGATTVICTDKTGTLTQNQMKIYETQFYGSDGITDVIKEGIAVNSTAYLDFSDVTKVKALGNPTEGALLLWLYDNNINYLPLREDAEVVEQLTFSTERKYMATIVNSPLLNRKVLYVKGAPEIVLDLCKTVPIAKEEVHKQLLEYQNKAMRTLAFAYQIIEDDKSYINESRLQNVDLTFLGIVAISDPVRAEVPEAVVTCLNAGIDVKIVTGDTPGTAKEIGRQIGLWEQDEDESHHLTGAEFAAMSNESLLDRILDMKILSRARPMDKQRLVQLLQSKNQVVAVTGDGTNDAPALNVAQVGLSMGDGTSVAKEASDITILDNSFSSISRAVMWGRSLYQNIQRFILFQMTINVAACLIVLIGAFLGTESPLTVTQMLWVNLIMDTFAALALASLPPNEKVMKNKPRKTTDYIISKSMGKGILGVGIAFVILLFGLLQYFKHTDITSLTEFNFFDFVRHFFNFDTVKDDILTPYELSLFFTIFVLLQFWNMFNAKAFMSGKSAFAMLNKCSGFLAIAVVILFGQWLIVTVGGEMFNVVSLKFVDWAIIIGVTSLVFWIGEIMRVFKKVRL
ncbi:MAG: calcium-translocating P-type ATPase, PMCA-type [Bacteroidales bacterium]|jgi:Ca2+-transporting ATPase|nr:calcium-translocating P-type ATPase, PMCA-type [Bacteroidales bacterium]